MHHAKAQIDLRPQEYMGELNPMDIYQWILKIYTIAGLPPNEIIKPQIRGNRHPLYYKQCAVPTLDHQIRALVKEKKEVE